MKEICDILLAICAGITCIAGAVAVIVNVVVKIQSPNKKQDERIKKLEETVKTHDEILNSSDKRFVEIENGNRVMQRALLALLSHGIDGNEIDGMRRAKTELETYLTSK